MIRPILLALGIGEENKLRPSCQNHRGTFICYITYF